MSLSSKILSGGASASVAVISALSSNAKFQSFSSSEGKSIKNRDDEDGDMLSSGINLSISTGVLSASDRSTHPTTTIKVDEQSPEGVAETIISSLPPAVEGAGRIVTIVGLSGVGKGTTVSVLKDLLAESREDKDASKVLTWSNGNIFRSLTLLTSLHMKANSLTDVKDTISGEGSKDLKAAMMDMLKFEMNSSTGSLDTHIIGYGVDHWVADVQNTELKGELVKGKIPTIAQSTQGEVVKFVRTAVSLLLSDGIDVIVEGREETVSFIASKNRFELKMEDESVIGMRRAAQRVAGKYEGIEGEGEEETMKKLDAILEEIV